MSRDEWEVAPLGSRLLRIETGRSPSLTDSPASPGQWGVLKVSAVHSLGYRPSENKAVDDPGLINERFEVKPGDLLFSRANTPELVGSACIATPSQERLMLSDKTLRLVVDQHVADARFVNLSLASPTVRKRIAIGASGSSLSMQNISQAAVEGLMVGWPCLAEQQRVVEVVMTLADEEHAIVAALAKLRTVRRAVLASVIAPAPGAQGGDGVVWRSVREVGEVRMGKQLSPSSRQFGTQLPYLRVANVHDRWIDYSDVKEMGFNDSERHAYQLLPGDILLNEGQSLELVGRSAIYRRGAGEFYFQNTLVRFRAGEGLLSEYAQAVFSYWLTTGVFAGIAKKTTSIAHLGGERFAALPFPLPTLENQQHIVRTLSAWDDRIASEEAELDKLRRLRRGLTDDLLSGKVRVREAA
ncbi:restriction endonuclease subunit S [Streptomyces umbrinus]|uniref:restriction endonuclease subunit S n=1 Tax=Streptomyces umbrinus TaxID=67370 RepID=UPI0034269925